MAKAKKIRRLQGSAPPGARGRTAQTTAEVEQSPQGALPLERRTDSNRPTSTGGGKTRGDRRDMSKTYSDKQRHPSRGSNPRPDVKTRKR